MVRAFQASDLPAVMEIWLNTNIQAHHFITSTYWVEHYALVKASLPRAEVYVHEDASTKHIDGFIGLLENQVAGLFVQKTAQSKGIGKQLLEHAKSLKPQLHLSVYQKNARAVRFYQREAFQIQSAAVDNSTGEKEFRMIWYKSLAPSGKKPQ